MNYKVHIVLGIVLIAFLVLTTCYHEPSVAGQLETVCFDTEVLPVLQSSCARPGCHDGSAEEFTATDYDNIIGSVTPGNPRKSVLYDVITRTSGENRMPPDQPLSLQQRMTIEIWIAQGAENIVCGNGQTGTFDSICFVQNILPLFLSNCAMSGCHDGLSQGEEELYALNSYSSIRNHVTPFSPSSSTVYRAVTGNGEDLMPPPPRSPLSSAQKKMLSQWINDGALNSDCPGANCDTSGTVSYSGQVKPLIDSYCISCHNGSVSSGGVNLSTYEQVKLYGGTLRNQTPVLTGTIRHLAGFSPMPPSVTLDECSIRKVEIWIGQGMLNN